MDAGSKFALPRALSNVYYYFIALASRSQEGRKFLVALCAFPPLSGIRFSLASPLARAPIYGYFAKRANGRAGEGERATRGRIASHPLGGRGSRRFINYPLIIRGRDA